MAVSKKTALDMLSWFKEYLDDDIQSKTASISGGDKNVIEVVKVNNSALPVSNKAVNIDLSAYAKTADVNSKLATIHGGQDNVIEAISIDGNPQPVTNKTAALNLSAYAKKTDLAGALSSISSLSTIINEFNTTINALSGLSSYTLLPATPERLGGIKIGSGLVMDEDDVLHVATYLPIATTDELGGVIVGEGLSVTDDGVLSAVPVVIGDTVLLPATKDELGGIIVGSGLSIKDDGTLSVIPPESVGEFFLTAATEYDLGGVIVGGGLSITEDGILSVTATGGQSNVIENISIDGKLQIVTNKTAILSLSAYAKKTEVGSGVRMKGSVNSFANLPANALTGDLYNIKQAGGSDGEGIPIQAGDNVVFTDDGKWDVMAGFIDTSSFVTTDDFTEELKDKLEGLSSYTLPKATTEKLGGIIVGGGLSITEEGVLSAPTTNEVFGGANATAGGSIGLVPAPLAGYQSRFLRGDAMWARIPEESINLIVSSGASNDVIVDAFSYPPNRQGALWMDYVDEEYVLKLHIDDKDYIFKPDKYTPADIEPLPPADDTLGEIYYLETVPSKKNGGLWYTLDTNGHPTLWMHRQGTQYSYDFGFDYYKIAVTPSQDNLYSYWLWRPNYTRDLMEKTWTTKITEPVVEETDFGIYALRNMNTALTNTTQTDSGWEHVFTDTHVFSYVVQNGSTFKYTLTGKATFTIDFWLSFNAVTSDESVTVFNEGDASATILTMACEHLTVTTKTQNVQPYTYYVANKTSPSYTLSIKNTGLYFGTALLSGINELEVSNKKRIHIAITHSGTSGARVYVDGKSKQTTTGFRFLHRLKFFPYMVGKDYNARGLYIDHFRIWNTVVWDDPDKGFNVPTESDYIIW